ncbi:hypothetical protein [Halorubellus salinus]|uniref:hypothetical protein n=1 Tax=Halorubellus salinus TaxID=755309 RepID=UPI001D07C287|nr:hypothetical protein [Halorubellus salinus]
MSPGSSPRGRSLLVAAARFVAHWLALSVGLLPFAFVVAAVDVGYPWLVGGTALGLAAVAVDRDVGLRTTGALSLAAVSSFFALQAAAAGALGDPSTAWTVGAAGVAYLAAVVVVRADPASRVRALVDPGTRGRSRD